MSATSGKIVYVEIPTDDIERSAEFYRQALGWQTRRRGDGALAFDDATGDVSGAWVRGRPPSTDPGLLIYVRVDDVAESCRDVERAGGAIVAAIGVDPGEVTARFADPYGNVLGLYQEPDRDAIIDGLAPWLSVRDATAAVEFYRQAFGAQVLDQLDQDGEIAVARLRVGGAEFWVQQDDAANADAGSLPVRMILSVADPDAAFARAVSAGAVEIAGVHEDHGWRTGRLRDPAGHEWETSRQTAE